jgi:hypothetical protein
MGKKGGKKGEKPTRSLWQADCLKTFFPPRSVTALTHTAILLDYFSPISLDDGHRTSLRKSCSWNIFTLDNGSQTLVSQQYYECIILGRLTRGDLTTLSVAKCHGVGGSWVWNTDRMAVHTINSLWHEMGNITHDTELQAKRVEDHVGKECG